MKTQILMILFSSMALTSECFAGGGSVGDGLGVKYCFSSEDGASMSPSCSGEQIQKTSNSGQDQFCCVTREPNTPDAGLSSD